jgi:alpha-L-fucosidase
VIVVECTGSLEVKSNMPSLVDDQIMLPADFADIHNPGYGTHAILKGSGEEAWITNWVDYQVRLEWMFNTTEAGSYMVKAQVRAEEPGKLTVRIGEEELDTEINADDEFAEIVLGEIEISETGDQIISLRPVREGWKGMELGTVMLVKQ